ncbi:MAG: hypothetical protein HYX67_03985 [Candidatus Melainabacteria bacterium]|nr:hypothetical protein [Candidatus Melainabacteria bacterium]
MALDKQPLNDGQDNFHTSSRAVNVSLGSNSLREVQMANLNTSTVPSSFGNFSLDSSTRAPAPVTMAAAQQGEVTAQPTKPGHIRMNFPPGWTSKKGTPGHDCGPVTIYSGKNGGVDVDFKPGPNGCEIIY